MNIDTKTSPEIQRKLSAILQILAAAEHPIGSNTIAMAMEARGMPLKQRMIRNYLRQLDRREFTENLGRQGRRLTPLGRQQLDHGRGPERIDFISATVDALSYTMTLNLMRRNGTVILNISRLPARRFRQARELLRMVLDAGLGMGEFLTVTGPGQAAGGLTIPDGTVGIGTVCSVTLNGVFRIAGIPVMSRFGGLLEIRDHTPWRFTQVIHYDGTTIDPVEIFIKGHMTQVRKAALFGNGIIGASFREIPGPAWADAKRLLDKLRETGLGGIQLLGQPGCALLDIPVAPGRCGLVIAAGLNPMAAIEEMGIETENHAMAQLADFDTLIPASSLVSWDPELSTERAPVSVRDTGITME